MPGSFGRIAFGSDFVGRYDSVVWGATALVSGDGLGDGLGFTSVNEGSFASTVDEAGGVLAITTDTADDDNGAILAGKFAPRDGLMWLEARVKALAVDSVGIWVGFTETLDGTTPVMPSEFATATMTYNGTGGMIGACFDADGTTDDWRAVMGDGGAAISDSANGIRATATVTNDRWDEIRVNLYPDGSGEVWVGNLAFQNSLGMNNLRLIKHFTTGTLLTTTDLFFATVLVENHNGGGAEILEIDYMFGEGGRDWRAS